MWNGLVGFVQRCHARMVTLDLKREAGQAMVEYSLILALVSIAGITVLLLIGPDINTVLTKVEEALKGA